MRTVTKVLVPASMAFFLMLLVSPLNAKVIDLSGTWKLNLAKSDGGKGHVWKEAIFKVVHKEPALKYSFTGTDAAEGKPFNSEFDGAIDGKPYKETGPQGGTITTLKRINDFTIEGTQILTDGKTTVTFTHVTKDGKVATVKMTVKGPEGENKQLIVYEKQ